MKSKSKKVGTTLDESTFAMLENECRNHGLTRAAFLRRAIVVMYYLDTTFIEESSAVTVRIAERARHAPLFVNVTKG